MPLMRGTKRRSEPEPESEAESSDASPEPPTQRRRTSPDDDVAYDGDNGNDAATADSNHTLVKKMVRLALACEYQRRPIRRADISEKVLGSGASRRFKEVFNAAQVELRSVFGMEMAELPSREKVTVQQKRAAQKSQSQASKPTTSWILISVLPPQFRDPAILAPPTAPTSEEDARYTSLYTLLTSLILLSGGALPDAKMERYLRRLDIVDNVPFGAPASGAEKTEKLLKRMEKDGYVVKIKEASGTGEDDVYWVVGPRSKVEVGDGGVSGLVKAVYGAMEEDEEDELERRIARSLGLGEPQSNGTVNGNGAEKKKRGRKRRDEKEAEANDQEDEDEEEDSEDELIGR